MLPILDENINYCVIDAARAGKFIEGFTDYDIDFESLYEGRDAEAFADVCPYLVGLIDGSAFNKEYLDKAWGNSWGIQIISDMEFDELIDKLRDLVKVEDAFGKNYYFRFYDPRVLRTFLPDCDDSQLHMMFSGVEHYIVEAEDPQKAIDFYLKNGKLQTRFVDVTGKNGDEMPDSSETETGADFDDDFDTIV